MNIAIYRTSDGKILRFINAPLDCIDIQVLDGEEFYLNCNKNATHIINNEPVTIEEAKPLNIIVKEITDAIQKHLDSTAKTRNYDNMVSLVSYSNSTDPIFRAEAEAGIAWRDACWRYSYNELERVKRGERSLPSPEQAVLELPVIVWPE